MFPLIIAQIYLVLLNSYDKKFSSTVLLVLFHTVAINCLCITILAYQH